MSINECVIQKYVLKLNLVQIEEGWMWTARNVVIDRKGPSQSIVHNRDAKYTLFLHKKRVNLFGKKF